MRITDTKTNEYRDFGPGQPNPAIESTLDYLGHGLGSEYRASGLTRLDLQSLVVWTSSRSLADDWMDQDSDPAALALRRNQGLARLMGAIRNGPEAQESPDLVNQLAKRIRRGPTIAQHMEMNLQPLPPPRPMHGWIPTGIVPTPVGLGLPAPQEPGSENACSDPADDQGAIFEEDLEAERDLVREAEFSAELANEPPFELLAAYADSNVPPSERSLPVGSMEGPGLHENHRRQENVAEAKMILHPNVAASQVPKAQHVGHLDPRLVRHESRARRQMYDVRAKVKLQMVACGAHNADALLRLVRAGEQAWTTKAIRTAWDYQGFGLVKQARQLMKRWAKVLKFA